MSAPTGGTTATGEANGTGGRAGIWEAVRRHVPAVGALRGYSRRDLGADVIAGLTVAAVAVPQAMAYATVAGVPPQYGLYTAVMMTLVGALLDSSRQLINGPTNAISIAVFSAVALLPAGERLEAAVLLALMVGVIQVAITLFRLGDLTRYISHGVIVGFTLGAGVLLALGQLLNLLGLKAAGRHEHFLLRFSDAVRHGQIHWPTAAVGLATIAAVLGLREGKRLLPERHRLAVPEFLIAVVAASSAVWALGLDALGVAVVGRIPQALPGLVPPAVTWERVQQFSGSALAIAVLGLLEAIAMAKGIAARTKQKLDINQQCLSEGVANCAGSFFQCFPGSGSLTRSAINQQAGAVSQWSGVIAAGAVALTVLLFAPLAYYIPTAALAGILMLSAWRMVDRVQLLYHLRATRFDAGIVLVTALSAVFISVEFCILIGIFLSFVLYVPRAARLELTELTVTPERVIRERTPGDPPCGRILIYNVEGELFFGSAPDLERHLQTLQERATEGIRIIVLRLKRARNPDAVCLAVVSDFLDRVHAKGVKVIVCGVRADLLATLQSTGLDVKLGSEHIFEETSVGTFSTLNAVRYAYDCLREDYCETCPRRHPSEGQPDAWYYVI